MGRAAEVGARTLFENSMFSFGPSTFLELDHVLMYAAGLLFTTDDRDFS